jgi:predicted transcriptional regulator
MPSSSDAKTLFTFRVSPRVAAEVRTIAQREDETQSTIVRRLIRVGLATERRSVAPSPRGDEAA